MAAHGPACPRAIESMLLHPTSWRSILILFSHLRLGFQVVCFHQMFLPKPCIRLSYPLRATWPAHLILDFITRTILGEAYRSFSSSLCSFLHSPVTSSLLGPYILLSTLFSNTLKPAFLPQFEQPSFTPIQNNGQNYISLYLNFYISG